MQTGRILRNLSITNRNASFAVLNVPLTTRICRINHQCPVIPLLHSCKVDYQVNVQTYRYKSKSGKNKAKQLSADTESEDREDKDVSDEIEDKHTKTLKINVTSMRLDAILKAALGMSRNKIDVIFYESKTRVNGEKVLKKSLAVQIGDEIDIIKGVSITNPEFLSVARIELLSVEGKEDSISVKIRRCKSLTIENYEGKNSWHP